MNPEAFLKQLDELAAARDWQGIVAWCDTHYEAIKPLLGDEGRDAVESGFLHTAYQVLEGRRRQTQAKQPDEGDLVRAA